MLEEEDSINNVTKPPSKCNILGITYRTKCIVIVIALLIQNLCLELSFPLRKQLIKCKEIRTGLDSFLFQYGNNTVAYVGLIFTLLNTIFNVILLIGCILRSRFMILCWFIAGGIPHFAYLIVFQSFCLYTKSCLECDNTREANQRYIYGFGLCIAITLYCYVGFIFNVQLYYSYLKYENNASRRSSEDNIFITRYNLNTYVL